jgi:hypothetical protein
MPSVKVPIQQPWPLTTTTLVTLQLLATTQATVMSIHLHMSTRHVSHSRSMFRIHSKLHQPHTSEAITSRLNLLPSTATDQSSKYNSKMASLMSSLSLARVLSSHLHSAQLLIRSGDQITTVLHCRLPTSRHHAHLRLATPICRHAAQAYSMILLT